MSDSPRRRRSDDDTGGGLPLFPLIVIVIFAGLLLGGVLAHFFGGSGGASGKGLVAVATAPSTPLPTPLTLATPRTPRTAPALLRTALPSPMPRVTPKTSPTPLASPSQSASPAATATATHSAVKASPAAKTPPPVKTATAVPATPSRAAAITPAPNYVAPGTSQAAGIVRSYLGALARGDRATATSYLASGLPGETFMSSDARIVSVHSLQTTGSQYRVTADVRASTGEYYVTFTLEPGSGGLQIVDHYSIRM